MSETHRLKQAFDNGRLSLGAYSEIGSTSLIELMGYAGLDFTVVDLEHSAISMQQVEEMARAASMVGLTLLVRVPEKDYSTALRVLDIGANGVVFPHTSTKSDAMEAVAATKYYPKGSRGMGRPRRVWTATKDFAPYFASANRETLTIVQIEDPEGVKNIEEILGIEGVDAIDTGPGDLSQSLGVPMQSNDERVVSALTKVYEACSRKKRPVALSLNWDASAIRRYLSAGTPIMLKLGTDETMFFRPLKNLVSEKRNEFQPAKT